MISSIKTAGIMLSGACLLTACSPSQESISIEPIQPLAQQDSNSNLDETTYVNELENIVQVAQNAGTFNTLIAAATAAGLTDTLASAELTIFAPTDDAFAKLPEGTVESLLEDPEKLSEILQYHVVAGTVTAANAMTLTSATTLQGGTVSIDTSSGNVMINDATVTTADVMASNGVIHIIDTVLLPN